MAELRTQCVRTWKEKLNAYLLLFSDVNDLQKGESVAFASWR